MSRLLPLIALLASGMAMGGCNSGDQSPESDHLANALSEASQRRDQINGEPISVPTDPNARYTSIRWSRLRNGHIQSVSVRESASSTDFERREINCKAMTSRSLGEGDTLQEAMKDSGRLDEMSPLQAESISWYVADHVCSEAAANKPLQ